MFETDAELLTLIREGDPRGRAVFAERYTEWARLYANKHGASDELGDDISQDLLVFMITRPPSGLTGTTVRRYMRKAIRNRIASARTGKMPAMTPGSRLVAIQTSPSAAAARKQCTSAAWRAICELSTAERIVFPLRYRQGLTFAEIARITGRPEKTVSSAHNRALEKVHQKLSRFSLQ